MNKNILARDLTPIRLAMLVTVVTASASFCLLIGGSDLLIAGDGILGAGYALLIG